MRNCQSKGSIIRAYFISERMPLLKHGCGISNISELIFYIEI